MKYLKTCCHVLMVLFLFSGVGLAGTSEIVSTLADQQGVAVTIYNENLALVKDKRRITLQKGENRLAFREVSARMRPQTSFLQSTAQKQSFTVLEQNFDFDLVGKINSQIRKILDIVKFAIF